MVQLSTVIIMLIMIIVCMISLDICKFWNYDDTIGNHDHGDDPYPFWLKPFWLKPFWLCTDQVASWPACPTAEPSIEKWILWLQSVADFLNYMFFLIF